MPESVHADRILLECIAGRDEHARIFVDQRPVRIGHAIMQPALIIAEMPATEGYLIVQVVGNVLQIDASNCLMPVYLNNIEIIYEPMRETDVLRIGNSIWHARYGTDGNDHRE